MLTGIVAWRLGHTLVKGGGAMDAYVTYEALFALLTLLLAIVALFMNRHK